MEYLVELVLLQLQLLFFEPVVKSNAFSKICPSHAFWLYSVEGAAILIPSIHRPGIVKRFVAAGREDPAPRSQFGEARLG